MNLHAKLLKGRLIGLERETLRLDHANNALATTAHPKALGSALTHPSITTDFGEQMMEFVTKPHSSLQGAYDDLLHTTTWVQQTLAKQGEYLWPYSMPPVLPTPDKIQHADFGSSGAGQFKELYRIGLTHRYGTEMQLISGMHFNYSLPEASIMEIADACGYAYSTPKEARNQVYLAAIRNINRFSWLSCYLLGASPAVDKSFIHAVQAANELPITDASEYNHASSLRLSDVGYTNKRRCRWQAELNQFTKFIDSIAVGLAETCSIFGTIGVKDEAGKWKQLNDKVLQIENEYYSIARPKAISTHSEPPLVALYRDGVTYLEFRMTDLDPFSTIGIDPSALRFLEVFTLYCMTQTSKTMQQQEREECDANRLLIANQGQSDDIQILEQGVQVSAAERAKQLLKDMLPIARVIDESAEGPTADDWPSAQQAIAEMIKSIDTQSRLSQRITTEVEEKFQGDINAFAAMAGKQHQADLASLEMDEAYTKAQQQVAEGSLQKAAQIADENTSLEDYMATYQNELDALFAERKIPILN